MAVAHLVCVVLQLLLIVLVARETTKMGSGTSGGVGLLAGVLNMLWNSRICTNV